jgi:hypothetical protein
VDARTSVPNDQLRPGNRSWPLYPLAGIGDHGKKAVNIAGSVVKVR